MVVWNPLAHKRTDLVTARLDPPLGAGVRVVDSDGAEVPALVEHGGRSVSWLARDVPSLGWRSYRLVDGDCRDGLGSRWTATRLPTSTTGCASIRPAAAG